MDKIKFAKVKENAIIPSKRLEDAGYDIYSCFEENYILIQPHETVMIPSGIASAFNSDYVMILKERGSTGTKGLGQRSGCIDSNYRGEWLIPITNHNDKLLIVSKLEDKDLFNELEKQMNKELEETYGEFASLLLSYTNKNLIKDAIIYPYSKAICQALLLPVPKVEVEEITYEELQSIKSNRGDGKLGSSGK